MQQEYNGNCKPLTLRFGTVECSDGFHKGSECKHKCKDGYGLHRMSPAARTCVCTKWGCVWMRKVFKLMLLIKAEFREISKFSF